MTKSNKGSNSLPIDVEAFVKGQDVGYHQPTDKMIYRDKFGEYHTSTLAGLARGNTEAFAANNFEEEMFIYLKAEKRIYNRTTFSHFKQPDGTLNELNTAGWLKPIHGQPHHWLFDVIMQSFGNGEAVKIEYFERLITYFYLHPQDSYKLPVTVIVGEGSVGKDLFVKKMLATIFDGQTTCQSSITGAFRDSIVGKVVVMVNELETSFGKKEAQAHKNIFGAPSIPINRKNKPQIDMDNIAIYFVGSNDEEGGIWLGRDKSDRRYSIMKVTWALQHWIALHNGTTDDYERDHLWMINGGDAPFSDREEIAKWLGNMIDKHGAKPMPLAHHGKDYQDLLDLQATKIERVCEAVFRDPNFTHISGQVFLKGYNAIAGTNMGDRKIYTRINAWLRKQPDMAHISTNKRWHYDPKGQQQRGWFVTKKGTPQKDNMDDYLGDRFEGVFYWKGPDIW